MREVRSSARARVTDGCGGVPGCGRPPSGLEASLPMNRGVHFGCGALSRVHSTLHEPLLIGEMLAGEVDADVGLA